MKKIRMKQILIGILLFSIILSFQTHYASSVQVNQTPTVNIAGEETWLKGNFNEPTPLTKVKYEGTGDNGSKSTYYRLLYKLPNVDDLKSMGYEMQEAEGKITISKNGKECKIKAKLGTRTGNEIIKMDNNYYIDMGTPPYHVDVAFAGKSLTLEFTNDTMTITASRTLPDQNLAEEKTVDDSSGGIIGWLVNAWGWVTDTVGKILSFIEEWINRYILLPLADGFLHMISLAVGEPVTIDRILYNRIDKLNINFWGTANSNTGEILSHVINVWYNIFRDIAIVVSLVAFLYVGIKIVLSSTVDDKEKYKDLLTGWVTSIVILFLFPYVMKYTVEINNTLIQMVGTSSAQDDSQTEDAEIMERFQGIKASIYGKDEFIDGMTISENPAEDLMMYTRGLAAMHGRIPLTFVYCILIVQTLIMLVIYYKRMFMMAFLITIFPLVTMTYAIDRAGDKQAQAFSAWFKEYIVNVFVQLFHVITYALMIDIGITQYVENDNWFFLIISIMFLFQGEKILRNIFSVQSGAETIKDLSTTGLAIYGMTKGFKEFKKDKNSGEDKVPEARQRPGYIAANTAVDYSNHTNENTNIMGSGGTSYQSYVPQMDEEMDMMYDTSTYGANTVVRAAIQRKNRRRKWVRRVVGFGTKAVTLTAGAGFALAGGLNNVEKGISTMAIANEVGNVAKKAIAAPIRGISNIYAGKRMQSKIQSGKMDQQLGLDNPNVRSATQQKYREALARMAGETSIHGQTAGENTYWKTISRDDK